MIAITLHDRIVEGPPQPAARVPLDLDGPFERAAGWLARRLYGKGLDPLRVALPYRRRASQPAALSKTSEEHTSELQARGHLVCRPLLEKMQIIHIIRRIN